MSTVAWIIGGLLAIVLMYIALYRIVRERNLSDSLVLWGLSPVLIVPILLYALCQKRRDAAVAPGSMNISLLDKQGLLFLAAMLSLVAPVFISLVIWMRYRALPRQLDADGFELRNGKRHLWAECEWAFSDSTGWLGLEFPDAPWVSIGPANRRTAETSYALQRLQGHAIPMDARCTELLVPLTAEGRRRENRFSLVFWFAAFMLCAAVIGAWQVAEHFFGEVKVTQFAHTLASLAFLGSAIFCASQAVKLWQPGSRRWGVLLLLLAVMNLCLALLFYGWAFLTP